MSSLENIYISPLEACNLHCRYCYTQKTKNILSNQQILSFIHRYQQHINLKSIIFCGGEVFTLKNFPHLINKLNQLGIFTTIITNGTINRLSEIKDPQNCQLLVSFDGPGKIHDFNRGPGNFNKSKKFIRYALNLGFPVEIFFLITKNSYPFKDSFDVFKLKKTYLVDRLGSLTSTQIADIRQNYPSYPPKNFGCSILSLQSDAKFYACCESAKPIASLHDPIPKIIKNYLSAVSFHPLCSDPDFFCNLQGL
jgi:sulfatase maturation enzyme AslB (radical SAM superfamily)